MANVPSGSDYTKIYSNAVAFAALKTDGSIKAWGEADSGGTNAPVDKGYTKIYSNTYAFAALKADGSIKGCIVTARRCSSASRIWVTPRRD
jgi:hypothetical protein